LFAAYGIPVMDIGPGWETSDDVRSALDATGPCGFVLRVDPEQTYFPKITSRVTVTGGMESQPLHLMTPDLAPEIASQVFRYI
jgi:acetolactate synthase-1/2/3 large subunit